MNIGILFQQRESLYELNMHVFGSLFYYSISKAKSIYSRLPEHVPANTDIIMFDYIFTAYTLCLVENYSKSCD